MRKKLYQRPIYQRILLVLLFCAVVWLVFMELSYRLTSITRTTYLDRNSGDVHSVVRWMGYTTDD